MGTKFYDSGNRARLLVTETGKTASAGSLEVIGYFYDGLTDAQKLTFPNEKSLAVSDVFIVGDEGSSYEILAKAMNTDGTLGTYFNPVPAVVSGGIAHINTADMFDFASTSQDNRVDKTKFTPTTLQAAENFTATNTSVVFGVNQLHEMKAQPEMTGAVDFSDRPTYTQTGLLHNPYTIGRLRFRLRLRNHANAADSAFLRKLVLSRKAVLAWPSGGYSSSDDELTDYLQRNMIRTVAAYRHKLTNHQSSWVLGLTGSIDFAETFPNAEAYSA